MKGETMDSFQPLPLIGLILLIVGLILAVIGDGFTAIVEVPTMLLSNTLSYTRLFAVGASSAGIAYAFNTMGVQQFNAGGTGIIFCVIILFIGHFINILLGLIGPSLHSLRLHYVEFFIKFYEGGGNRFMPFGKRRRYTTEN